MSNPETDDGVIGRQPPTCPLVLPEKFYGTGNFEEWISHFESISIGMRKKRTSESEFD